MATSLTVCDIYSLPEVGHPPQGLIHLFSLDLSGADKTLVCDCDEFDKRITLKRKKNRIMKGPFTQAHATSGDLFNGVTL